VEEPATAPNRSSISSEELLDNVNPSPVASSTPAVMPCAAKKAHAAMMGSAFDQTFTITPDYSNISDPTECILPAALPIQGIPSPQLAFIGM
jgi:hypothetical protein